MNAYNLIDESHNAIIYHAIAESEEQVRQLAAESDIDIKGLTIDLEKSNIRPEYGRSYTPSIQDAIVR